MHWKVNMKKIIFLRGVTPTGTNRIPKMSYLVEIQTEVGFLNVQTYIQSGNILLESELSDEEIRKLVHDTILDKIGADLSIIIKEINQLEIAIQENPFDNTYDSSRIHLVFTNEEIPEVERILEMKSSMVVTSVVTYIYHVMLEKNV